ncbi:conserved hypothetical protein [Salmonella phage PVPSE1]|uniref:Uncharacterized protein 10 n=2 Tax=Seunavirus TaxID=1914851 RepID=G3BLM6_9CAUD|nr:hypothetical protein PVP-SE1_gp010 [Salmonella phage PVPSE1]YP_009148873.1 hypothetical protein ACQ19_gp077 [Salmonella phage SSE121]ADP02406.1 conserved hypothetical protein [Salmonella phage PVPSE1]AFU63718.1 hypothetical protein [Salmonella phage SSE121]
MLLQADKVSGIYPIDQANPSRAFTSYGTPAGQSTVQAKFGQYSFDCRNGGFQMSGTVKPDLAFAKGDPFTIEFWSYNTAVDSATWWMYFNTGTSSCLKTYQSTIYLQDNSASVQVGPLSRIPTNQWNHIAIVYDGTNLQFYVNGNRIVSQASAGGWSTASSFARVMGGEGSAKCFMDQFRISGVARYSGTSFTVPTAPFDMD